MSRLAATDRALPGAELKGERTGERQVRQWRGRRWRDHRWSKPLRHRLRDGVRYRCLAPLGRLAIRALGWLKHRVWRRLFRLDADRDSIRVHLGCGGEHLSGWVNIDVQPLYQADLSLDVTRGLPFSHVEMIFAEHFLEHLEVRDALRFLAAANRALHADGWIRLSTPNLDWVWRHVYRARDSEGAEEDQRRASRMSSGLHANRSFYGWQHRFIWNRELLEEALKAVGFEEIRWCEYGRSRLPELDDLERHERYEDSPLIPHVLIAEAKKGRFRRRRYRRFRKLIDREFLQSRSS